MPVSLPKLPPLLSSLLFCRLTLPLSAFDVDREGPKFSLWDNGL
jgi:hypothetical protein